MRIKITLVDGGTKIDEDFKSFDQAVLAYADNDYVTSIEELHTTANEKEAMATAGDGFVRYATLPRSKYGVWGQVANPHMVWPHLKDFDEDKSAAERHAARFGCVLYGEEPSGQLVEL
jgi:hypothetical protein